MEKLGIKKIKYLILLAGIGITNFRKAFEDGKVTFWEGLGLISDVRSIPQIIALIPQVKEEFNDLDEAEKNEIFEAVKNELGLSKTNATDFVNDLLSFVVSSYTQGEQLYDRFKALKG